MTKEEKQIESDKVLKDINNLLKKVEKLNSLKESRYEKVNMNRFWKLISYAWTTVSLLRQYHKIKSQPILKQGSEYIPIKGNDELILNEGENILTNHSAYTVYPNPNLTAITFKS